MNIGYFKNFRGADSVLLDGTADEISGLISRLSLFVSSQDQKLLIHQSNPIVAEDIVELFCVKTNKRTTQESSFEYCWLCSDSECQKIINSLRSLVGGGSGHHYFPLVSTSVQLLVSVGEYGEDWWRKNG